MTAPKILVGDDDGGSVRSLSPAPEVGWYLLGVIGGVFAVVAAADIALSWIPLNFGNAEWEFGTVTASLDGFPLLSTGLALVLGSAVVRGVRPTVMVAAVVVLVLALLVVAGGVLYARRIPTALATVTDPVIRAGLKEAIIKTLLQAVLYSLAFVWIGIRALRHARG